VPYNVLLLRRVKGTHTLDPTHAADSYSWIKPPAHRASECARAPDQAGHDRGIQHALALRSEKTDGGVRDLTLMRLSIMVDA
jgi:cellulase/cellobiase CelA1